jgi:iron complex outermembrane receptor protein
VGLRYTLEPDPDNTGVGSFRSQAAFFLEFSVRSPVSWSFLEQGEPMHLFIFSGQARSAFRLFTNKKQAWAGTPMLQPAGRPALRFHPPVGRQWLGALSFPRFLRKGWEPRLLRALLLLCLAAPLGAIAQNPAPTTAGAASSPAASKPAVAQANPAASASQSVVLAPNSTVLAPQSTAAAQPLPRVSTTVVVHGHLDEYLPESVTVGTLDGAALMETPLSATVVTRKLMEDQGARLLSDLVKNDASMGEDYAPVGYYGDYEIRGFPIDLATGLEINGLTIAGEQDVPLENKQRVEFLKGIAGVESGVASAGGLIDYVTKRPAAIKAADLATDQRGTAYGAVDLGTLFGSRQQVGVRVNLAAERIASYVNGADGWRAVGAGAADWHISPQAILKGDFEYQHKVERSVSGYQLLGGTTLPDLGEIYPSTMLGEQSWEKPNTFDTFNANARFDYDLPRGWKAFAAASLSHSLIDDNVVYAYGTPFDSNGNVDCPGAPDAPAYFFCPAVPGITKGGDYGIYDYRSPGELRIDAVAQALATGHVKTGAVTHDLTFGGELFLRSVQLPGAAPKNAPDWIVDGAVYSYIGQENIYQPLTPFSGAVSADGVRLQAGPRALAEDNHQSAAVMQDRLHLPGRIQLLAGGRFDSVRDHNDSGATATGALDFTNRTVWLPEYAVTFNPAAGLMLYGNYGVLLSLGPQAPWWAGGYYLNPFLTRQAEVGAKYSPGERILLTAAFFHMRAPFFYPKDLGAGADCFGTETTASSPLCFVSEGRETHDGVELNAQGKATNWLSLTGSAAAIRAISSGTGTPAFDNKQALNVPHLRTALFADLALPRVRGLHLLPGWSYTGRKEATRDDAVSVSGYNLFNLGARYTPGGDGGRVTLRLYADNITNRRYWKDTGASYGDTFIHLGAPTTVRFSAHYRF